MTIRLLIADDQDLVRGAMAALLGLEADLEVVAHTGRGDEVVALCREHEVDIALLDIEMPGMNGIEAAAALAQSGLSTRVIMVTTFGRPGYLRRAVAASARGFIVKDTPPETLAQIIRDVSAGKRVVDSTLAAESLGLGESPLSDRETEVLRAAASGASIREIAATVHLSEGTVRNHLSAIIGKCGARNRAEAAKIAETNGWL